MKLLSNIYLIDFDRISLYTYISINMQIATNPKQIDFAFNKIAVHPTFQTNYICPNHILFPCHICPRHSVFFKMFFPRAPDWPHIRMRRKLRICIQSSFCMQIARARVFDRYQASTVAPERALIERRPTTKCLRGANEQQKRDAPDER